MFEISTVRSHPYRLALGLLALTFLPVSPAAGQEDAPKEPVQREMTPEESKSEPGSEAKTASIDLDAARAAVSAVDDRYNQLALERNEQAFRKLLSDDVVFLADEVKRGRLAMLVLWRPLFDSKYGFTYEAKRLETHVAASGEFAYTLGTARTSYTPPGLEERVTDSFYLNIWRPAGETWHLIYTSALVVHPTLGSAREPRTGLMTAWPQLADQIGSQIDLDWRPETTVRAASGDMAYSFGEYEASFKPLADGPGSAQSGKGHFLAVWQKDQAGVWQLAAEGFTPPGIHHNNDP